MQFILRGQTYDAGKIDAMRQFHIVRRLAPVLGKLAALAPQMDRLKRELADTESERLLASLGEAVSVMPDADVEYVLNACLDVTQIRQESGGWAKLRANGVIMFPIDLATMLGIAAHVLKDNLSGFFDELPSALAVQGTGSKPTT